MRTVNCAFIRVASRFGLAGPDAKHPATALEAQTISGVLSTTGEPGASMRPGSGHESLCPHQVVETTDQQVILGVTGDGSWKTFCDVAGERRVETVAIVDQIMRRYSREQWLADLGAAGVPCAPLHNLSELCEHLHTQASGMMLDYADTSRGELQGVAQPLGFNGERQPLTRKPPRPDKIVWNSCWRPDLALNKRALNTEGVVREAQPTIE